MPRHGLDTDAVVGAAAALADAEGLEAVTLAAQLGVRAPSLYSHVDGLDDLRQRVAARGAWQLSGELQAAAAGRARGDALAAIADAYRAYGRRHPGTYAALQRAPDDDGPAAAAAASVVDVVVAALRGYGLEGDEAIHAVRIVRAALHGFIALENDDGFGLPLSPDESFGRLIEVLDRGLTSPRA
jgi:Tetracyclin repressor-like, C-terminal domain